MKQVIQSMRTGEQHVVDVPVPRVLARGVLVATHTSLVSAGTERMVVDFAEKNLIEKARARPDLVRQALDKAQREGILSTWDSVRNGLDQPIGPGYSCAGTIIDVGAEVSEFQIGDRVACAGGGYASHAQIVTVPKNLVVKLPGNVDFESGTFATIGAIALQGIRLAEAKLGEVVAVIGLGMLGQLTVQMLNAAGCIVVGMDIQEQRAILARQSGAVAAVTRWEDMATICSQLTGGHGADSVLITADTKSNEPVEVAGEIARTKGIVVAVGAVGMNIPRKVYYEKEIDFRISRSYGPGRYDAEYEEKGHDYPYSYVRWTEQRNMQAFLELIGSNKINIRPLITHSFPVDEASKAYETILGKTNEPFLGVIMTYPELSDLRRKVALRPMTEGPVTINRKPDPLTRVDQVRLGIIGAGNFANGVVLPAVKDLERVELVGVASGGMSARATADRFKFAFCTTDSYDILDDKSINTVAILTRHHLHAQQTIAALQAGKHVYVEKPLCLNEEELDAICDAYQAARQTSGDGRSSAPLLMVGFNRRFAPFVTELKQHLGSVKEPLILNFRVNAGFIPPNHWVHDLNQGGGRLLGEGCHFIDVLNFLLGRVLRRVHTRVLPDSGRYAQDNLLITLGYDDGSIGTVTYVANGDRGFGKEALEVFGGGLSARLDDYRTLSISHGKTRVKRVARLRQDKGHRLEWKALVDCLTGSGPLPISMDEIICSTRATFAAYRSLQSGEPVTVEHEAN